MQKSLIFVVFLALFFSHFLLIFSHFLVYFDDILATFCVKKNGFGSDLGTHFDTSGLHFWEQVYHIISRPLRRLSQQSWKTRCVRVARHVQCTRKNMDKIRQKTSNISAKKTHKTAVFADLFADFLTILLSDFCYFCIFFDNFLS